MPIVMNINLRLQEPLQWKGWELFTAYKGKGPTTSCGSHRGLLVCSVVGKAVPAVIRKQAMGGQLRCCTQAKPLQDQKKSTGFRIGV